MLTLTVQVPESRDRTAPATLRDGLKIVAIGHAAASATPSLAAQHANPGCDPLRLYGHPPLGRYTLLHHEPTAPAHAQAYGRHLLLFEPESGPALEAESFGRLALLAFGGATGADGAMRRTHGGLRLGDAMVDSIAQRLSPGKQMTLNLVALEPRRWWQFWKSPALTHPLSNNTMAAPADELALLEALLQKSVRRERAQPRDDDRDAAFGSDRDSDRTPSTSSAEREAFSGKGGQSGGAGASGSWRESPGDASVDSAGRIVGVAAAAAAVGAVAAMAATSAEARDAESGASDAGIDPASSGGETSTAY